MKTILSLLAATLCAASVQAQSPTPAELPPLPSGALPARPGSGQWTITESDAEGKAPQPQQTEKPEKRPAPKSIRVSKAGNLRCEQGSDALGDLVRWCDGTYQFIKRTGWTNYTMVTTMDTSGDFVDFSRTDFPDCSWVNAENYCAVIDGCYVFKNKKAIKHPDESIDPPLSLTCYVDKKSLLPVKLTAPGKVLTYQYQLDATPDLKLPDELQSLEDIYKARMGNLRRRFGRA